MGHFVPQPVCDLYNLAKKEKADNVLQELTKQSEFDINLTQRNAWEEEISILKDLLQPYSNGQIIFEYGDIYN